MRDADFVHYVSIANCSTVNLMLCCYVGKDNTASRNRLKYLAQDGVTLDCEVHSMRDKQLIIDKDGG